MNSKARYMHAERGTKMNKVNWARKLTSRKWWIAVAAFVVACLQLFDVDANTIEKIGALILLAADVVGYSIAEGLADAGSNITFTE